MLINLDIVEEDLARIESKLLLHSKQRDSSLHKLIEKLPEISEKVEIDLFKLSLEERKGIRCSDKIQEAFRQEVLSYPESTELIVTQDGQTVFIAENQKIFFQTETVKLHLHSKVRAPVAALLLKTSAVAIDKLLNCNLDIELPFSEGADNLTVSSYLRHLAREKQWNVENLPKTIIQSYIMNGLTVDDIGLLLVKDFAIMREVNDEDMLFIQVFSKDIEDVDYSEQFRDKLQMEQPWLIRLCVGELEQEDLRNISCPDGLNFISSLPLDVREEYGDNFLNLGPLHFQFLKDYIFFILETEPDINNKNVLDLANKISKLSVTEVRACTIFNISPMNNAFAFTDRPFTLIHLQCLNQGYTIEQLIVPELEKLLTKNQAECLLMGLEPNICKMDWVDHEIVLNAVRDDIFDVEELKELYENNLISKTDHNLTAIDKVLQRNAKFRLKDPNGSPEETPATSVSKNIEKKR